jgi:hypothetical protein
MATKTSCTTKKFISAVIQLGNLVCIYFLMSEYPETDPSLIKALWFFWSAQTIDYLISLLEYCRTGKTELEDVKMPMRVVNVVIELVYFALYICIGVFLVGEQTENQSLMKVLDILWSTWQIIGAIILVVLVFACCAWCCCYSSNRDEREQLLSSSNA